MSELLVDGSSSADLRCWCRPPSWFADGDDVTTEVECRLTPLDHPPRLSVLLIHRTVLVLAAADCVTARRCELAGGGSADSRPTDSVVPATSSHVICGISPPSTHGKGTGRTLNDDVTSVPLKHLTPLPAAAGTIGITTNTNAVKCLSLPWWTYAVDWLPF